MAAFILIYSFPSFQKIVKNISIVGSNSKNSLQLNNDYNGCNMSDSEVTLSTKAQVFDRFGKPSHPEVALSGKAQAFDRFDKPSHTATEVRSLRIGKSIKTVVSEQQLNRRNRIQLDAIFLIHIIALVLTIIALIFAILTQLHDEQWNYFLEKSQILANDHNLHKIFYPLQWRRELERQSITLIFAIVFITLLSLLYLIHIGFYAVHNKFRMYYRIYPTLYLHAFFIVLALLSIILLITSTHLAARRHQEINEHMTNWYNNMPKILKHYSHFYLYPPQQSVFFYCYNTERMDNNYKIKLEKLVCPQEEYKLVAQACLGILIVLHLVICFLTWKLKKNVMPNYIQPTVRETIYQLIPPPIDQPSILEMPDVNLPSNNNIIIHQKSDTELPKHPKNKKHSLKKKTSIDERPEGRVDFFDFGPGVGHNGKEDYKDETEDRIKELVAEDQKPIRRKEY